MSQHLHPFIYAKPGHLYRVIAFCFRHGFKAMLVAQGVKIWSDSHRLTLKPGQYLVLRNGRPEACDPFDLYQVARKHETCSYRPAYREIKYIILDL